MPAPIPKHQNTPTKTKKHQETPRKHRKRTKATRKATKTPARRDSRFCISHWRLAYWHCRHAHVSWCAGTTLGKHYHMPQALSSPSHITIFSTLRSAVSLPFPCCHCWNRSTARALSPTRRRKRWRYACNSSPRPPWRLSPPACSAKK